MSIPLFLATPILVLWAPKSIPTTLMVYGFEGVCRKIKKKWIELGGGKQQRWERRECVWKREREKSLKTERGRIYRQPRVAEGLGGRVFVTNGNREEDSQSCWIGSTERIGSCSWEERSGRAARRRYFSSSFGLTLEVGRCIVKPVECSGGIEAETHRLPRGLSIAATVQPQYLCHVLYKQCYIR